MAPGHAEGFWSSLSWWHSVTLPLLLALSLQTMDGLDPVMCATVSVLWGTWAVSIMRAESKATPEQDEKPPADVCSLESFQIPSKAGIVAADVWKAGAPKGSAYQFPVECAPLSREQEILYVKIQNAVAGKTFGELRRDPERSFWLVPPNQPSARLGEAVDFDPRDIVRVVNSVLACKAVNAAETGSHWLQQIYALRFDHAMELPKMRLKITPEELGKCRSVYPKAVYGVAEPHGYPILWDMVSALRLRKMADAFGSADAALDRIMWYDLHIMELLDRYRMRLSAERDGVLILKGVNVIDLGAWKSDLMYPGILRTVMRIIARSGSIWPESIWRLYLVNVPWVFMAPWAAIKKACHPVTLAKLRIFSNRAEFLKHLDEELGVSIDQVPKEHGGRGPSLVDLPVTPTAHLDQADC